MKVREDLFFLYRIIVPEVVYELPLQEIRKAGDRAVTA
jgi:hypothetical protein